MEVYENGRKYHVLLHTHDKWCIERECDHFVDAFGYNAERFTHMLGPCTDLHPVKHQALITHRLPDLGKNGDIFDMLIDCRKRNDFSAVYGQQFAKTRQTIACASPAADAKAEISNSDELKLNTRCFVKIVSEILYDWILLLATVPIQTTWSGYHVELRYIVDPGNGLFVDLQGRGFTLA